MIAQAVKREKSLMVGAVLSLFFAAMALLLASNQVSAQSVEKADTSQQTNRQKDELQLAREAVEKPAEKSETPNLGHIMGDYEIFSSMEFGYRSVDTSGSQQTFLSDVNVKDGFRLFDYSLDARSISGKSPFFDFLRVDINNAGGDQNQYYSLRMDKAREYKFDATLRQFNYFRALPSFADNEHNFDLRQQVSDFNLKLFPQRPVKINISYGRSMAKGPLLTTYDYQRNEFPINGYMRWAANDYRIGADINIHHWDIFVEQLFRRFREDASDFTTSFNAGNEMVGPATLSSFLREAPTRSQANVSRISLSGNISRRAHLVLRALYSRENLTLAQYEQSSGLDEVGNTIVSSRILDSARVNRPSASADALFTFDITDRISLSNAFRFINYRIVGEDDASEFDTIVPIMGKPGSTVIPAVGSEFTGVASYWNTFQANFTTGTKFSMSAGLRSTYRDITLHHYLEPDEKENDTTNTFVGAMRYRPVKRVGLFLNYERGSSDNAFVNIAPLDYQQVRVRSSINASEKLAFNFTFSATDRTNPTPFVKNDGTARSVSADVAWQPNSRVWINGGYDYDYLFSTANIYYFINFAPMTGSALYYARQDFVFVDSRLAITKRLDLLLAYRYVGDRGAPKLAPGTLTANDFLIALPLTRHNPEARLAYRFTNHITGNIAYRHYSYSEGLFAGQDYRANIFTTSVRLFF
jgi:hypothetical protein